MKSINEKNDCEKAAIQAKKQSHNVIVKEWDYNTNDRPTGCSWHALGNLELWKSTNGNCNVNGYAGCFCRKNSGWLQYHKNSIFIHITIDNAGIEISLAYQKLFSES